MNLTIKQVDYVLDLLTEDNIELSYWDKRSKDYKENKSINESLDVELRKYRISLARRLEEVSKITEEDYDSSTINGKE